MTWRVRTLGEICDEVGGVIQTGPFGSQLHESDYVEEGIPVVMPKNIVDGRISTEDIARISEVDVKRLQRHVLAVGDIVYGRRGDIGRRALITERERGWFCGTGCLRVSLGNTILDPTFLYYYLGESSVTNWIANQAIGATLPNLNTSILRSVSARYPSLSIQRRIASILSAYDNLIENNTRRIKILEDLAKMIYREWFVNFQFPGHEKVKMAESEVGLIPQGWCVEPLERHLSVIETGNRPKGGIATFSEGMPSIGAESILGVGRFDYAKTKYVPVEYFQKMKLGILQDRDVLVYKDGGQPGNFHPHVSLVGDGFPFAKMVINSHVYRIRVTERITQDFLYYHLSSDESLKWMHRNGTGSAIPGLARKDLLRLPLIVPPKTLVQQFERFAKPLNSLILITARRTQTLRKTKEYLLPKLISGEVRVEQFETEAVAQGV